MRIHKEGLAIVIVALLFLMLLLLITAEITYCNILYEIIIGFAGITLLCFLLFFFRNPERKFITDSNVAFTPADGRIVAIEDVYENEYLNVKCQKISIFMSIYNVHVNRYTVSGKISYTKYHPGKYLVARHPKSSELNERQTTVIEKPDGVQIMIRQIAGTIARRIICYAKVGAPAMQGDDVGFIRFGSRVGLFLPLNSEICVKMNEAVKGNKTVVARFNS